MYSFCCTSVMSGTYTATHTDTHHTQIYRHNAHTQTQAHILVDFVGILSLEGTPKTGHVAAVTFPCYPFVPMECLHAVRGGTPRLDRNVYRERAGLGLCHPHTAAVQQQPVYKYSQTCTSVLAEMVTEAMFRMKT